MILRHKFLTKLRNNLSITSESEYFGFDQLSCLKSTFNKFSISLSKNCIPLIFHISQFQNHEIVIEYSSHHGSIIRRVLLQKKNVEKFGISGKGQKCRISPTFCLVISYIFIGISVFYECYKLQVDISNCFVVSKS